MRPAHFLNLRWRQDYRFVTELRGRGVGPLEQAGLRLQQTKPDGWALYSETLPEVGDIVTLFGRKFLEFDGRRAVWQHSLIYPVGARDDVMARAIFRAAYGGDPGLLLPDLYELLAPLEHWEGDPLVRRMFLGEPNTPPEPVAATLIRELWSARLPLGKELSAKIDALERALLENRGRGCLDEPTEEVQPGPPEEQSTLQLAASEPPGAHRDWHRLDPRWASEVLVASSELNSSVDQGDERSEADLEAGLGSLNVWSEPRAAQTSIEENDERSVRTLPADEADEALRSAGLSDPGASATVAQDEGAAGAPAVEQPGDAAREAGRSLGLGDPDESAPSAQDEPPRWGLRREPLVLAPARLFDLPTEEIPLGSLDWLHRPEMSPDEGLVRPLEGSAEEQVGESAAVDEDALLDLEEEDGDDEDDRKTVVERSVGNSPHRVWLNSAQTHASPSALSSLPTLIHIPRATAADLAALPSVATSAEHTPTVDTPPTVRQADDRRGRSMIMAASLGLLAALLALWIIWHRATTDGALQRGGEQAREASRPLAVAPSAMPSQPIDPALSAGPEVSEVPTDKAPKIDCYPDKDLDGYWAEGAKPKPPENRTCPSGTVEENERNSGKYDCDDSSEQAYPGARELCDGVDNNCDGKIDNNSAYRDDDKNGEIDCVQWDFGDKKLSVGASPVGGPGNPNYSLEIKVRMPETAAKGATCTPYVVVESKGSGKIDGKLKRGEREWTCHVPIGDSTPLGDRCFPKGKRLVGGEDEVMYTVECCFFNVNSYRTFQLDGYEDSEKHLTCEFWRSGSKTKY